MTKRTETSACKRCAGKGHTPHSANRGICYSCGGKGEIYTAKGRAQYALVYLAQGQTETVAAGVKARAKVAKAKAKAQKRKAENKRPLPGALVRAQKDLDRQISYYRTNAKNIAAIEALLVSGARITHKMINAIDPNIPKA